MDSKERHERRYQRRVQQRREKKEQRYSQYNDYNSVFTIPHLKSAYKKSRKGVRWKGSVQKYEANVMINIKQTYDQLHNGTFKSKGFYEFDLNERGKLRHIKSVIINERVVQRCLCDYCLVPLICPSFIYDNAASQKGKGIDFSKRRIVAQMQQFYRKYGNQGYILQFDFSKYFDTMPHKKVMSIIDKFIKDKRLNALTKQLVKDFGDEGLGLGSQVSQVLSLACADDIDHVFKEKMKIRAYGRYMDDGYLISEDKEYLQKCLEVLKRMCEISGIKPNLKKTHITKLSHGFTFLKLKFTLTSTGKVLKRLTHANIVRMRRKLKKLAKRVDEGKMSFKDVTASMQSWIGHTKRTNSYKTLQSMLRLYRDLFKYYFIGGQECIKY